MGSSKQLESNTIDLKFVFYASTENLISASIGNLQLLTIINLLTPYLKPNHFSVIRRNRRSPDIMGMWINLPFALFCLVDLPQEVKGVKGLMINSY